MEFTNQKILLDRISKNIRKLRKQHNFTQEYVAEKTDIHLVTYQRYESKKIFNNIRIYNLYKIATLYNVTLDSLLK